METTIIDSRRVLDEGGQVYARISLAGVEKIISASLIELYAPDGQEDRIIARFEIGGLSDSQVHMISEIRELTIYILSKGVLYAIPSKLNDFEADSTVRFIALMPPKCRGAILRHTERYSVFGTYRIYRKGTSDVGCKLFAVPMNVSMGGFGMHMELPDIKRGEQVNFEISLFTAENGKASKTNTSVDLSGIAKVCSLLELNEANQAYIGFGFTKMPSDVLGALAFWLRSHQAILTRT